MEDETGVALAVLAVVVTVLMALALVALWAREHPGDDR